MRHFGDLFLRHVGGNEALSYMKIEPPFSVQLHPLIHGRQGHQLRRNVVGNQLIFHANRFFYRPRFDWGNRKFPPEFSNTSKSPAKRVQKEGRGLLRPKGWAVLCARPVAYRKLQFSLGGNHGG